MLQFPYLKSKIWQFSRLSRIFREFSKNFTFRSQGIFISLFILNLDFEAYSFHFSFLISILRHEWTSFSFHFSLLQLPISMFFQVLRLECPLRVGWFDWSGVLGPVEVVWWQSEITQISWAFKKLKYHQDLTPILRAEYTCPFLGRPVSSFSKCFSRMTSRLQESPSSCPWSFNSRLPCCVCICHQRQLKNGRPRDVRQYCVGNLWSLNL